MELIGCLVLCYWFSVTPALLVCSYKCHSFVVSGSLQSQAPLPSVQLAVEILQDLLQYSSQLPELAREVGLNSILGILTSLLSLKLEVKSESQTLLENAAQCS